MKKLFQTYSLIIFLFLFPFLLTAQQYAEIPAWDTSTNRQLEEFLHQSLKVKERKVAVFDCDGTLLGQVPYYLVDEAICIYADEKGFVLDKTMTDTTSREASFTKSINERAFQPYYLFERVKVFRGNTTESLRNLGRTTYEAKYTQKIYPEMVVLIENLKNFGFEIWVVTASPEVMYQPIMAEAYEIPPPRILGAKSIIDHDTISQIYIPPLNIREGKRQSIETYIKAKPMLVAGNSRDDLEMILHSTNLKMIVNPDDNKVLDDEIVQGQTLKSYCKQNNFLIVPCIDSIHHSIEYKCKKYDLPVNEETR